MNRLQNRLNAYEKLVESQDKTINRTIELLEMQLRNERLKNNNLTDLYRLSNGVTSVED